MQSKFELLGSPELLYILQVRHTRVSDQVDFIVVKSTSSEVRVEFKFCALGYSSGKWKY